MHVYALGGTGAGPLLTINGSGIMPYATNYVFMDGIQITPGDDTVCFATPVTSETANRYMSPLFYGSKPLAVGTQVCAATIPPNLFYAGSHTLWLTNANGASETITFNIPAGYAPNSSTVNNPQYEYGNPLPNPSQIKFEIATKMWNDYSAVPPVPYQGLNNGITNLQDIRVNEMKIAANSEALIPVYGIRMEPGIVYELYDGSGTQRIDTVSGYYKTGAVYIGNQYCAPGTYSVNLFVCGQMIHLAFPASMSPGRYLLRAKNPNGAVSNWTDITVVAEGSVGTVVYGASISPDGGAPMDLFAVVGGRAGAAYTGQEATIDIYGHGFSPSTTATIINQALPWNFCLPDPWTGQRSPVCDNNNTTYTVGTLSPVFVNSGHIRLKWTPQAPMTGIIAVSDAPHGRNDDIPISAGIVADVSNLGVDKYSVTPTSGSVGSTVRLCYTGWADKGLRGDTYFKVSTLQAVSVAVHPARVDGNCAEFNMGPTLKSEPSYMSYWLGRTAGGIYQLPATLDIIPGFYVIQVWWDLRSTGPSMAVEIK